MSVFKGNNLLICVLFLDVDCLCRIKVNCWIMVKDKSWYK